MSDNYRLERIERLLAELKYEVTRGMMEREIEEDLTFEFQVPVSRHFKNGAVSCRFSTRPVPDYRQALVYQEPRLRVVSRVDDKPQSTE